MNLWDRILKRKGSTHWYWMGAMSNGYPVVRRKNRLKMVRRLVWEERRGPIPPYMYVREKCKVRECLNPAHLYLSKSMGKDELKYSTALSRRREKSYLRAELELSAAVQDSILGAKERGVPIRELARKYEVRSRTIRAVLDGTFVLPEGVQHGDD